MYFFKRSAVPYQSSQIQILPCSLLPVTPPRFSHPMSLICCINLNVNFIFIIHTHSMITLTIVIALSLFSCTHPPSRSHVGSQQLGSPVNLFRSTLPKFTRQSWVLAAPADGPAPTWTTIRRMCSTLLTKASVCRCCDCVSHLMVRHWSWQPQNKPSHGVHQCGPHPGHRRENGKTIMM